MARVVVVFEIGVNVENGAIALSHLTTFPVFPLKVKVGPVVPLQMVVAPRIDPATVAASTVTVVVVELVAGQEPL